MTHMPHTSTHPCTKILHTFEIFQISTKSDVFTQNQRKLYTQYIKQQNSTFQKITCVTGRCKKKKQQTNLEKVPTPELRTLVQK